MDATIGATQAWRTDKNVWYHAVTCRVSESLSFSKTSPMHGSWIGLVNTIIGKAAYLGRLRLFYRRHGSNVTMHKHGSATCMLARRRKQARETACGAGTLLCARRELKKKLGSGVAVPASGN